MAGVPTASRPQDIPGASGESHPLAVEPPSLPITTSAKSFRTSNLTLDTFSPVTQNGSFEFDRIVKQGEVLKRTRKTKSWKPIFMVLRPGLLSIYRDKHEIKLRHQIRLSELTAIARQKDPKRREKHVFGLFSPSRNYHLEALSDREAQEWVDAIREESRIDQHEEAMVLASPGGTHTASYQGFERSVNVHISPGSDGHTTNYASSSDAEVLGRNTHLPRVRDRQTTNPGVRKSSYAEYSGAEHGSYSDFSDINAGARLSALSLSHTDPRPSTSSTQPPQLTIAPSPGSARPSISARTVSQMSGLGMSAEDVRRAHHPQDEERVVFHGWINLLKSKSGVRQWKKVWLVLRPKGMVLYKNEEEYSALLVLSLSNIIDAVEIDPISKSKTFCMQIISEERNYRFCAYDEESLARCLGAFKSLLTKRNAKRKEVAAIPPVAVPS